MCVYLHLSGTKLVLREILFYFNYWPTIMELLL